ncbi:hypothetical protein JTE90_014070 [Oedothorax gibbosus]|uniref:Uncharacterized protein n=1 Tax=Oedothorax gibbosus TaxID=931172 RepID=A0AAV6TT69_9ARAC|nr:hypothetical protein JTE90_014070 [Oedothorax gibbosus]
MFCFAGDVIMFPEDPLGRGGPRLKDFLAFPPESAFSVPGRPASYTQRIGLVEEFDFQACSCPRHKTPWQIPTSSGPSSGSCTSSRRLQLAGDQTTFPVSSCTPTCGQLLMSSSDMTQFGLLCAHHKTAPSSSWNVPRNFPDPERRERSRCLHRQTEASLCREGSRQRSHSSLFPSRRPCALT